MLRLEGLAQPQQPARVAVGAGRRWTRCSGQRIDYEDGGGGVHSVQPGVKWVRSCGLGGIRGYRGTHPVLGHL